MPVNAGKIEIGGPISLESPVPVPLNRNGRSWKQRNSWPAPERKCSGWGF
jgi:hypothetical protein